MATFHFDLVSPEKLAFSGEVDQVDIPGVEGDFGVLAGHAPVIAAVRPGILTVTTGGAHQKVIVLGGLAEVSEKGLTVLGAHNSVRPPHDSSPGFWTTSDDVRTVLRLLAGGRLNVDALTSERFDCRDAPRAYEHQGFSRLLRWKPRTPALGRCV